MLVFLAILLVYEHVANVQNKNRLFDFSDEGVFMMRYLLFAVIGLFFSGSLLAEMTRTATGKPDLSGFYNTNMLIPLQRPSDYGDERYMSEEQSKDTLGFLSNFLASSDEKSDPNRGAPTKGGDGNNTAGAGGVVAGDK